MCLCVCVRGVRERPKFAENIIKSIERTREREVTTVEGTLPVRENARAIGHFALSLTYIHTLPSLSHTYTHTHGVDIGHCALSHLSHT